MYISRAAATGLIQRCDWYFSSILGRITRMRREANEQREKILRILPPLSPTIPSYASVATRNVTTPTTTAIRSIQDTKTDSIAKPEATRTLLGSKARQSEKNYRTAAKNLRNSSRRDPHTDVEKRHDRLTSVSTNRSKDSQSDIEWKKDRQSSREKSRDRWNCSETTRSPYYVKEGTAHSPRSRDPPSVVTESCGMKSKGVHSIKYVYHKKRKSKKKRVCLGNLLGTLSNFRETLDL